jgi:hypothetical protein
MRLAASIRKALVFISCLCLLTSNILPAGSVQADDSTEVESLVFVAGSSIMHINGLPITMEYHLQ